MTINIKNLPTSSQVAILGFGKEGQSSYRFLQEQGYTNISIIDQKLSTEEIQNILLKIGETNKNVEILVGDNALSGLETADIIIKSPGVSPFQAELAPYRDKYISQTEIFFSFYTGKVIGITGTKGKSTVASLVYETLKNGGYQVKIVGNIGKPVLEEIDVLGDVIYDYVIYELSSFMLEGYSPPLEIGYINNIHECHLDWHTNMAIYTQAKYNVIKNAKYSIVHTSLSGGNNKFPSKNGYSYQKNMFYRDGEVFMEDGDILLLGEHNRINICGALTILDYIFDDKEILKSSVQSALKEFNPLPHRLETIGVYEEKQFIDDGIAVTPEATIAAIEAVGPSLETLLVGGKDIGMNQSSLEKKIIDSPISNLVLFPDTGYSLFREHIKDTAPDEVFEFELNGRTIQVLKTQSMESAVQFALHYTHSGKTVLLSSAAQSYSLWKDFEEKGAQYKHYIEKHARVS